MGCVGPSAFETLWIRFDHALTDVAISWRPFGPTARSALRAIIIPTFWAKGTRAENYASTQVKLLHPAPAGCCDPQKISVLEEGTCVAEGDRRNEISPVYLRTSLP